MGQQTYVLTALVIGFGRKHPRREQRQTAKRRAAVSLTEMKWPDIQRPRALFNISVGELRRTLPLSTGGDWTSPRLD